MKRKLMLVTSGLIFILAIVIYNSKLSLSQILDNDSKVEENSDLTYYLDVEYDGKDKEYKTSSDTATANVVSDYIFVEDKIPEGLTFQEFVNTGDNTIGAVQRKDNTTSCSGYVVDGYNGLHYDANTRTVSFKVKNLQAGCKLTVGIKTKTPTLGDKDRIDFYNTAQAKEKNQTVLSNTVHTYIGLDRLTLNTVTYEYEGNVPDNAPNPPAITNYYRGSIVEVKNPIDLNGYTFSGWTTSDATISNNKFEMPNANVVLKGSFTKNSTNRVIYKIEGTYPEGYNPPKEKEYSEEETVDLDSLKENDVINGYKFLGWESEDIDTTKDVFEMPNTDVVITGHFQKIKYDVSYNYQGDILPPNASSYLPETKKYSPNEKVTVEGNPQVPGYKFLGWYKENEFLMPEEDVVIYGEWAIDNGNFIPTITNEIINEQDVYTNKDNIVFKITVTNNENYKIQDVLLKAKTNGSKFIPGEGYEVLDDDYIRIDEINPNSSMDVYIEYTVGKDIYTIKENEVELLGATSSTNTSLDNTREYTAKAEFKISNIKLNVIEKNIYNKELKDYSFELYRDKNLTNKIGNSNTYNKLIPGNKYYLKEIKTEKGYKKLNDILELTVLENGQIKIKGYKVESKDGINNLIIIKNKEGSIIDLPNTLDNIIKYIIIFVVAIIGLIVVLKFKKKGDNKNEEKIEVI